MTWTTQDHNNNDIRERTNKINEIGERLTQFFQDCATPETVITPTDTGKLVTHFSIAIEAAGEHGHLNINVLGNGKIQLTHYNPDYQRLNTIHKFDIRTTGSLHDIFKHTVFEMALNETCKSEFMNYGIDIEQGIRDAQNSSNPKGRQKIKQPPPVRRSPGRGKGIG